MAAADAGRKDIVDVLVSRNCNLELKALVGCTALMIAVGSRHTDVVDVLVAHNCNLDVQDVDGGTALMAAAQNGCKDIVEALVAGKCNLDLQNCKGYTALMLAVHRGHKDIVEVLVRHNCNLSLRTNDGWTALKVSKLCDRTEIAIVIKKKLRRNRNWAHRKALMMVLVENKYLLASPVPPDVLSYEKVLGNIFLVQKIMSYV